MKHYHVLDRTTTQDVAFDAYGRRDRDYVRLIVEECEHPRCTEERHGSLLVGAGEVERIVRAEINTMGSFWRRTMEEQIAETWDEAYAAALEHLEEAS